MDEQTRPAEVSHKPAPRRISFELEFLCWMEQAMWFTDFSLELDYLIPTTSLK